MKILRKNSLKPQGDLQYNKMALREPGNLSLQGGGNDSYDKKDEFPEALFSWCLFDGPIHRPCGVDAIDPHREEGR